MMLTTDSVVPSRGGMQWCVRVKWGMRELLLPINFLQKVSAGLPEPAYYYHTYASRQIITSPYQAILARGWWRAPGFGLGFTIRGGVAEHEAEQWRCHNNQRRIGGTALWQEQDFSPKPSRTDRERSAYATPRLFLSMHFGRKHVHHGLCMPRARVSSAAWESSRASGV